MSPHKEAAKANRAAAQLTAHIVMIDYLVAELEHRSPMTVYLLKLARQNLLDEFAAVGTPVDAQCKSQSNHSPGRRN